MDGPIIINRLVLGWFCYANKIGYIDSAIGRMGFVGIVSRVGFMVGKIKIRVLVVVILVLAKLFLRR